MTQPFKVLSHQPVIKSACIMFIITNFGTSLFVLTIPYVFIHDLGANERALSICFAMLGMRWLCLVLFAQ